MIKNKIVYIFLITFILVTTSSFKKTSAPKSEFISLQQINPTALCNLMNPPYWEGFNTNSETVSCWQILNLNNNNISWYYNSAGAYEGNRAACYNNIPLAGLNQESNDYLVSPAFDLDGGKYVLKYQYKTGSFYSATFEVLLSDSGSESNSFTETLVAEQTHNNFNYEEKVVFFEGYSGEINLAFHVKGYGSHELYIDNFFLKKVETCEEPVGIEIDVQGDDWVNLSWVQGDGISQWEVAVVKSGESLEDESILNILVTDEAHVSISGLEKGNVYKVYVRAVCEDGVSHSDWSTPVKYVSRVGVNDECEGAFNIPVNTTSECNQTVTGVFNGGSYSSIEDPSCVYAWDIPYEDIWFEFTAIASQQLFKLFDLESSTNYFTLYAAIYQADDCSSIELVTEMECYQYINNNFMVNLIDLEVGAKYYVRFFMMTPNAKTSFTLCMSIPDNVVRVSPSGEDYTIEELVKKVLVDSNCDLVSNIKYDNGPEVNEGYNTLGYFNKQKADFPFEEGLVLTTHDVKYTSGPYMGNVGKRKKLELWQGDEELNDIIDQIGGEGFGSNKATSVLEFDFIPVKDSLNFEYLFAAVSYHPLCGYACYPGGALFAAWLTDLSTGEGQNLAVVPDTSLPIALNTIRDVDKSGASCESVNPQYFGNYYGDRSINDFDEFAPINYTGMTIALKSLKASVKPGVKYHIKLAVADFCEETSHTSAVFFKKGSFDIGNIDLGEDLLIENNTALCDGASYAIKTNLSTDWVDFSWYKDGELLAGETGADLEVNQTGDYKVVAKYKAVAGCEAEQQVRVEIYPKVSEVVGKPSDIEYCVQSLTPHPIDLTQNEGAIFKGLDKEGYGISYHLTTEDAKEGINSISSPDSFAMPEIDTPTTIYVHLEDVETSCEGVISFRLVPTAMDLPTRPADVVVCGLYEFPSSKKGYKYFASSKASGKEYFAGDELLPGDYTIYVTNLSSDGCYSEVSYQILVVDPVEALELPDVKMSCELYTLPELPAFNRYYTEPGGLGLEIPAHTEILSSQTIYIYASSADGVCLNESSFTITYEECPLPRGFSPNGDGINDVLDLTVYTVSSIKVFNRNGVEVYSASSNYKGGVQEEYVTSWDGKSNGGKDLPDGTYYYVIVTQGKTKTGWIQINR
jgi:gliding motility-associated-like protein